MKVLLLSAYAAQSHVYWQRQLVGLFPHWQWQELSLPPRYFSWRVRGNPLYWSQTERAVLEQGHDLLIATSMVDLATLRGLVPALARVPTLLYFHENQFDYPQQRGQPSLLEAQMVSLYSALAADALAFNSACNRDAFIAGVDTLLRNLPDRVPPGIPRQLADKANVLPVPVDIEAVTTIAAHWPGAEGEWPGRPLRLLWTGRFEHDKGGEGLWRILLELEQQDLGYELAVTGQQFRNSPAVFSRIATEFSHRLVQFGYLESVQDYRALLAGADIVLSTALHEYQGLAVLEAVAAGCLPVVPDRQAYPEIYAQQYRYPSSPDDPQTEALAAARLLVSMAARVGQGGSAAPDVSAYGTAQLQVRYRELLEGLAGLTG